MATTTQRGGEIERRVVQPRGEIQRGVIYPLPVFYQRSGIGRKAVAKLRRNGMPVRRAGRSSFILGDDFLDALLRNEQGAKS